jgi:mannitol operon transcriptional antiterminator
MSGELTARQKFILQTVHNDAGVEAAVLARRLGISRRTLQRDLHALKEYLHGFGVDIDPTAPDGLRLVGEAAAVERALASVRSSPEPPPLRAEEREFLIASELLCADGPIKMAYFSRRLGVATASVSHYLDRLEDWFSSHGLRLVRRRGYGVEVVGSEMDKRLALAELLHEHIPPTGWVRLLRVDDAIESNQPAEMRFLQSVFGRDRLARVETVLAEELAGLNPPLDEAGFYAFMVHVLIALERLRAGQTIDADGAMIASAGDPMALSGHAETSELARGEGYGGDAETVRRILKRLAPDAVWSEGEVQYLSAHLRGAKVQLTEAARMLPANVATMELAHRIAERVSQSLGIPLASDGQLISGLAQHLEPAVYRMSAQMSIRNPLLAEVRRRYPELFDAVAEASRYVFTPFEYQVPDEEIGYLTMHVGAAIERWKAQIPPRVQIVCPNGISSAELLAGRVRAEFPQLRIVGVHGISQIDDEDCDLILSTVPISGRRVVTVSPFLTDSDISRIREALAEIRPMAGVAGPHSETRNVQPQQSRVSQDSAGLEWPTEVAPLDLCQSSASSVPHLIHEVAQRVREKGICQDVSVVERALAERERLGSVVLPGAELALLHARVDELKQAFVAVYRLAKPLWMNSVGRHKEPVRTVFVLLARTDESTTVLQQLGRLSSALIDDASWVESLHTADDKTLSAMVARILKQQE